MMSNLLERVYQWASNWARLIGTYIAPREKYYKTNITTIKLRHKMSFQVQIFTIKIIMT